MKPLVSVNIPTLNAEDTLKNCLSSVKGQTYSNIEILVIDGFSKDHTIDLAKQYGCRIYTSLALSDARRRGVFNSHGKYVLLVDSDQILTPTLIERCVELCEKEDVQAVTLFELSFKGEGSFLEKVLGYDKWLFHTLEDDHPIFGTAIPRFFCRDFLTQINWPSNLVSFDHNIIYYEVTRRHAKVRFLKEYLLHSEPRSWSEFMKKFYRYGYYYIPALQTNSQVVLSHSLPRRAYFTRRALERPTLFPGLFVVHIVKGLATMTGIIAFLLDRAVSGHKKIGYSTKAEAT